MAVRLTSASSQGLTHATPFDYNAAYTVLALIYGTTLPANATPFTVRLNSSNYDQFFVNPTGKLVFRAAIANNASDSTGTTTLATGTWYCVAMQRLSVTQHRTFLGTAPENIAQEGPTATRDVTGRGAAVRLDIGSEGGSGNFWNGRVRDVRVFLSALSLEDIQAAAGTMWAEWLLPAHTDLTDTSGNGRNLTAVGTPTTEDGGSIVWGGGGGGGSGEFWVDPATGSDGAAGTLAAPWKTLAKVNAQALVAGEIINLRKAGMHYPFREELVADRPGAVGNLVTYRGYGTAVSVPTKALASAPPAPLRTVNVDTLAELNAAIADAQPGDLINVAAGSYIYSNSPTWNLNGTPANPIVIQGVGLTTIIQGNSNNLLTFIGDNFQVRDLRIYDWFYGPAIDGATQWVFDSVQADKRKQQAFMPRFNSSFGYIQNCLAFDTGIQTAQYGEGVYIGGTDLTNNIYVLRCHFNCKANAVEFSRDVFSCWAEGNYIDGTAFVSQIGNTVAHIDLRGTNNTIVNNVFWKGGPMCIAQWEGSGHVIRLNRMALFDIHAYGDAHGIHISSGTGFYGADNIVTNIEAGGEAISGASFSTAYGSEAVLAPRPLILGSDMPFIWTADAQANTYYVVLATAPTTVRFDRVEGNLVGSKALVDSARDWFWDAGATRLYVFSARYPTLSYAAPGIEFGQRATAVHVTADYNKIEGLDLWSGNSATLDTLEIDAGRTGVTAPDTFVNGVLFEPPTDAPTAGFTVVVEGILATFTDTSTDVGIGTITEWDWNFGDGTAHGTTQNPTHSYATPGLYLVTLVVTDDTTLTDEVTALVVVGFGKAASITGVASIALVT